MNDHCQIWLYVAGGPELREHWFNSLISDNLQFQRIDFSSLASRFRGCFKGENLQRLISSDFLPFVTLGEVTDLTDIQQQSAQSGQSS